MKDAQGREVVPVGNGTPEGMTPLKRGRPNLHLGKQINLKLHADLVVYLEKAAAERYCTVQEYIRQLIVEDKRADNGSEWGR